MSEAEFIPLFVRHEQMIHGFILSLVPHWADAEEILQQTSLKLWQKFDNFEPGSDFRAWACSIARYEVLNFRRKAGRDRHLFSPELLETLAQEAESDLDSLARQRALLDGCLDKLPEADRAFTDRCYAPDTTIRDVADSLGRPAHALYKRLNRIRRDLMACIRTRMDSGT